MYASDLSINNETLLMPTLTKAALLKAGID